MALIKVQWKKPGEWAWLDEKDLNKPCGFTSDRKWHRFVEPAAADPPLAIKPKKARKGIVRIQSE